MRLGIIPAAIGPYVVRAIGERQAYRYFQTAERISADRAREIGLVHEVAEPDALDAKVQEVVDALLAGGPLAQAAATDLIRAVAHRAVDDAVVEDTARRIADAARDAGGCGRTERVPREASRRLGTRKSLKEDESCSRRSSLPTAARSPAA